MNIMTVILVYTIVSWMLFFIMLPIGVRSQEDENDIEVGTVPSAPVNPALKKKALAAMAVGAVITGIYWYLASEGVFADLFGLPY